MNLAIKHRPLLLNEVVGHTYTIKDLKKRTKENNFPNVILFSGDSGVGKTTLQLITAKNILCNNKDDDMNCCNQCDICNSINNDIANNYCFMYNASDLKIDDVRNIQEIAMTKTLSKAKSKVIIIDELQELNSNKKALNDFFKPLEKPLKNTYYILGIMGRSNIVNKAILRRAVKYNLNKLNENEIGTYLINICKKENIDLVDSNKVQTLVTITQNSEGSIGIAIPYLERIIYSDLWNVEQSVLLEELGIISNDKIIEIINDILNGKIEVLKNKITNDILEKINNLLLLYYKVISGYQLEQWRQNSFNGLGNFDKKLIEYTLKKLFELLKYNYISQNIIDFTVVDIINYCKDNKKEIPKRRKIKNENNN